MNILFLSEVLYPHIGGAELAIYLNAKLLAKSGHKIKIVTNKFFAEPKKSEWRNLTIFRLPIFKDYNSIKYSLLKRSDILLSSFIKKLIVWADLVYIPKYWYSAIPLAKAYGKRVITHLFDYSPICSLATRYDLSKKKICDSSLCHPSCIVAHERAKGSDFLVTLASSFLNLTIGQCVRRLIGLSDFVICVSKAHRDLIVKYMPSLNGKCHIIHQLLPETLRIETDGRDLGYFGGPKITKGFNVLYSALKHTKRKLTMHMAGGFIHSIQNVGHTKIIFHEFLRGEKYNEHYRRINTVIVPSVWSDPLPYVVIEALLNNRLVIASNIGGIPELVENCPGVFLFQPNDSERLAELMDYVNNLDAQTTVEFGAKNRETFLRKFNNEKILQDFQNFFNKVASS